MLVKQILKQKPKMGVLSLPSSAKVTEALEVMSVKRIGTVVVSDDGLRADGILSERDIVRTLGKNGAGCLTAPVAALMTPDPVTCTPETSGEEVLRIMTERRFRHIPVVENKEMIGLISIGDVVKARIDELAMEKDALEGMIRGL